MNIGSASTGSALLNSLTLLAHNSVGRATVAQRAQEAPNRVEKVAPGKLRPADQVELSPEALRQAEDEEKRVAQPEGQPDHGDTTNSGPELTRDEQKTVRDLEERDREVRVHEQAHKASGGQFAGAISLSTTNGPNGQSYATGGSVPINVSPVSDNPQATIAKMQQVRRAALAPAEPSAADQRVAAQTQQQEARARADLARSAQDAGETDRATRPDRPDPTGIRAAHDAPETESDSAALGLAAAPQPIRVDSASGTYAVGSGAQRFESSSRFNLVA